MNKLRILLAEDHETIRDGLKLLVNSQSDMEVVGEADNGRAALQLAEQLLPDVVVMDISMPELNGLQATKKLNEKSPRVKVLILTRHADKGPSKIGEARHGGLVGENTGVKLLGQPRPFVLDRFDSIRKVESLAINFDAQIHPPVSWNRNQRRKSVGLGGIRHAGHDAQMFANGFIVRDVQVMKLGGVVITDQASHLLKMSRFELNDR